MARLCTLAVAVCVALTGCSQYDVARLAGDDTAGRNNGTAGSTLARQYLIDQLKPISQGLNTSATGDAAYTQTLPGGTNVVGGDPAAPTWPTSTWSSAPTTTTSAARASARRPRRHDLQRRHRQRRRRRGRARRSAALDRRAADPPRRSVILALWDREEDGLLGSRYYVAAPARAAGRHRRATSTSTSRAPTCCRACATRASRSAPRPAASASRTSCASAIGAEHARHRACSARSSARAAATTPTFLAGSVPSVFFTDATGPCYHTVDDEVGIVDFDKLDQQIAIALRVTTRQLANTDTPPTFASGTPLATYDDAVALRGRAVELVWTRPGPLLGARTRRRYPDQGRPEANRARRPGGLRRRRRGHAAGRRGHARHLAPAQGRVPGIPARRPSSRHARWSASRRIRLRGIFHLIVKRMARQGFAQISAGNFDAVVKLFHGMGCWFLGRPPDGRRAPRARAGARLVRARARVLPRPAGGADSRSSSTAGPGTAAVATRFRVTATLPDGRPYENEGMQFLRLRWGKAYRGLPLRGHPEAGR